MIACLILCHVFLLILNDAETASINKPAEAKNDLCLWATLGNNAFGQILFGFTRSNGTLNADINSKERIREGLSQDIKNGSSSSATKEINNQFIVKGAINNFIDGHLNTKINLNNRNNVNLINHEVLSKDNLKHFSNQTSLNNYSFSTLNNKHAVRYIPDVVYLNDSIDILTNNAIQSKAVKGDLEVYRHFMINSSNSIPSRKLDVYRKKWAKAKCRPNYFASFRNFLSTTRCYEMDRVNLEKNFMNISPDDLNADFRLLLEKVLLSSFNEPTTERRKKVFDGNKFKKFHGYPHRKFNLRNEKYRINSGADRSKSLFQNEIFKINQTNHNVSPFDDKMQRRPNEFFNMWTFLPQPEFGDMTQTILPIDEDSTQQSTCIDSLLSKTNDSQFHAELNKCGSKISKVSRNKTWKQRMDFLGHYKNSTPVDIVIFLEDDVSHVKFKQKTPDIRNFEFKINRTKDHNTSTTKPFIIYDTHNSLTTEIILTEGLNNSKIEKSSTTVPDIDLSLVLNDSTNGQTWTTSGLCISLPLNMKNTNLTQDYFRNVRIGEDPINDKCTQVECFTETLITFITGTVTGQLNSSKEETSTCVEEPMANSEPSLVLDVISVNEETSVATETADSSSLTPVDNISESSSEISVRESIVPLNPEFETDTTYEVTDNISTADHSETCNSEPISDGNTSVYLEDTSVTVCLPSAEDTAPTSGANEIGLNPLDVNQQNDDFQKNYDVTDTNQLFDKQSTFTDYLFDANKELASSRLQEYQDTLNNTDAPFDHIYNSGFSSFNRFFKFDKGKDPLKVLFKSTESLPDFRDRLQTLYLEDITNPWSKLHQIKFTTPEFVEISGQSPHIIVMSKGETDQGQKEITIGENVSCKGQTEFTFMKESYDTSRPWETNHMVFKETESTERYSSDFISVPENVLTEITKAPISDKTINVQKHDGLNVNGTENILSRVSVQSETETPVNFTSLSCQSQTEFPLKKELFSTPELRLITANDEINVSVNKETESNVKISPEFTSVSDNVNNAETTSIRAPVQPETRTQVNYNPLSFPRSTTQKDKTKVSSTLKESSQNIKDKTYFDWTLLSLFKITKQAPKKQSTSNPTTNESSVRLNVTPSLLKDKRKTTRLPVKKKTVQPLEECTVVLIKLGNISSENIVNPSTKGCCLPSNIQTLSPEQNKTYGVNLNALSQGYSNNKTTAFSLLTLDSKCNTRPIKDDISQFSTGKTIIPIIEDAILSKTTPIKDSGLQFIQDSSTLLYKTTLNTSQYHRPMISSTKEGPCLRTTIALSKDETWPFLNTIESFKNYNQSYQVNRSTQSSKDETLVVHKNTTDLYYSVVSAVETRSLNEGKTASSTTIDTKVLDRLRDELAPYKNLTPAINITQHFSKDVTKTTLVEDFTSSGKTTESKTESDKEFKTTTMTPVMALMEENLTCSKFILSTAKVDDSLMSSKNPSKFPSECQIATNLPVASLQVTNSSPLREITTPKIMLRNKFNDSTLDSTDLKDAITKMFTVLPAESKLLPTGGVFNVNKSTIKETYFRENTTCATSSLGGNTEQIIKNGSIIFSNVTIPSVTNSQLQHKFLEPGSTIALFRSTIETSTKTMSNLHVININQGSTSGLKIFNPSKTDVAPFCYTCMTEPIELTKVTSLYHKSNTSSHLQESTNSIKYTTDNSNIDLNITLSSTSKINTEQYMREEKTVPNFNSTNSDLSTSATNLKESSLNLKKEKPTHGTTTTLKSKMTKWSISMPRKTTKLLVTTTEESRIDTKSPLRLNMLSNLKASTKSVFKERTMSTSHKEASRSKDLLKDCLLRFQDYKPTRSNNYCTTLIKDHKTTVLPFKNLNWFLKNGGKPRGYLMGKYKVKSNLESKSQNLKGVFSAPNYNAPIVPSFQSGHFKLISKETMSQPTKKTVMTSGSSSVLKIGSVTPVLCKANSMNKMVAHTKEDRLNAITESYLKIGNAPLKNGLLPLKAKNSSADNLKKINKNIRKVENDFAPICQKINNFISSIPLNFLYQDKKKKLGCKTSTKSWLEDKTSLPFYLEENDYDSERLDALDFGADQDTNDSYEEFLLDYDDQKRTTPRSQSTNLTDSIHDIHNFDFRGNGKPEMKNKIPFLYGIRNIDLPPSEFRRFQSEKVSNKPLREPFIKNSIKNKVSNAIYNEIIYPLANKRKVSVIKELKETATHQKTIPKYYFDAYDHEPLLDRTSSVQSANEIADTKSRGIKRLRWKHKKTDKVDKKETNKDTESSTTVAHLTNQISPETQATEKEYTPEVKKTKFKLFPWQKKQKLSTVKSTGSTVCITLATEAIAKRKESNAIEDLQTTAIDFYDYVSNFWFKNKQQVSDNLASSYMNVSESRSFTVCPEKNKNKTNKTISSSSCGAGYSLCDTKRTATTPIGVISAPDLVRDNNSFGSHEGHANYIKTKTQTSCPNTEPWTPLTTSDENATFIEDSCNVCNAKKTTLPGGKGTSKPIDLYPSSVGSTTLSGTAATQGNGTTLIGPINVAPSITPYPPKDKQYFDKNDKKSFNEARLSDNNATAPLLCRGKNKTTSTTDSSAFILKDDNVKKLQGLLQKHLIVLFQNRTDLPKWVREAFANNTYTNLTEIEKLKFDDKLDNMADNMETNLSKTDYNNEPFSHIIGGFHSAPKIVNNIREKIGKSKWCPYDESISKSKRGVLSMKHFKKPLSLLQNAIVKQNKVDSQLCNQNKSDKTLNLNTSANPRHFPTKKINHQENTITMLIKFPLGDEKTAEQTTQHSCVTTGHWCDCSCVCLGRTECSALDRYSSESAENYALK